MGLLITLLITLLMNKKELDPEMMLIDGFDSCFVGTVGRIGQPDIACYDYDKCIELLLQDTGMTIEDCLDHFHFNVAGAWVGDHTPCFICTATLDSEED